MTTQEIYDAVLLSNNKGIILTIPDKLVKTVKSRLSNMRSRQQANLGDFADSKLKRLDYALIPFTKEEKAEAKEGDVKLRISLITTGNQILVKKIEQARDF